MAGRAIVLVCATEQQADEYESGALSFMPPSIEVHRMAWPMRACAEEATV